MNPAAPSTNETITARRDDPLHRAADTGWSVRELASESGSATLVWSQVLDTDDVAAARSFVLAARSDWTKHARAPLWALGTPGYQFRGTREEYETRVRPLNRRFWAALGPQYLKVLARLSDLLGEPVLLDPDTSYPGFHIMPFDELPLYHPGRPHFDKPYERIPWTDAEAVNPEHNLSFTLPLELPPEPCGIEVFPVRKGAPGAELIDWDTAPGLRQHYQVGSAYVFSGWNHHRATPAVGSPGEYRMTMQGHIIRMPHGLVAYW